MSISRPRMEVTAPVMLIDDFPVLNIFQQHSQDYNGQPDTDANPKEQFIINGNKEF